MGGGQGNLQTMVDKNPLLSKLSQGVKANQGQLAKGPFGTLLSRITGNSGGGVSAPPSGTPAGTPLGGITPIASTPLQKPLQPGWGA